MCTHFTLLSTRSAIEVNPIAAILLVRALSIPYFENRNIDMFQILDPLGQSVLLGVGQRISRAKNSLNIAKYLVKCCQCNINVAYNRYCYVVLDRRSVRARFWHR